MTLTVFRCDNEEFGCEVVVKLVILAMHLKVQFIINSLLSTVYTVQCTMYSVHCTVYTALYTVFCVHCTVYVVGRPKLATFQTVTHLSNCCKRQTS